jgi:hypothetical protein
VYSRSPEHIDRSRSRASTSLSDQTTASTVSRPSCFSAAIR